MPETLVANDKPRIRDFVDAIGGLAVIKPLDGAGGEGVMALRLDDQNFNAIVEATTNFQDADILAKVSRGLGAPMTGIGMDELEVKYEDRGW